MRIALLTGEYPPRPGGIGDYTRRLGLALVSRGHHILVFTIADCRFQIVDLGGSNLNLQSTISNLQSDWGWGVWRDVIAALYRTRPEVLHIQYQTGAYAMRPAVNFLPWRLRGLPNRPLVAVTAHDLLPPYLFPKAGPLRGWVTRRLLTDADAVVVTNEADFEKLTRDWRLGIGDWEDTLKSQFSIPNPQFPSLIPIGSNITVAPPTGYERAAWRERLGVAEGETLVAYFGLISRTKALDTLLDTLIRLPAPIRVLVVGGEATAPEDRAFADEIERRIAAEGLSPRVTITGHCPEDQVSAHLLAADLAALPFTDGASFRRGSLLATLAHGLPTITTYPTTDDRPFDYTQGRRLTTDVALTRGRWPVVGGALVDGENALLVPPGDAGALASAIERLEGDAALRAKLAEGGRALAGHFSWEAIAARHEELYQRMART